MADVLTPSTTATGPVQDGKPKKGLRKALSKWKDRLKGPRRPSTSSSTRPPPPQAQAQQPKPQPQSQPQPTQQPPPPPTALFVPTTETSVSSPNDLHNVPSNSSSPQSTLQRRPSKSRRNTAPADYFSNSDEGADRVLPMNKITTTITATAPQKQRLRYRLSLSKRSSYQPITSPVIPASPTSPTSTSNNAPLASPAPSAPNPVEHEDRRATFQFTTAAEIAAKIKEDKEKLAQAADVIRRDKPKDWLDPGWREREEREREQVLEERIKAEKKDAEEVAGVMIGRDGVDAGPLRRWEWGR